MVFNPHKWLGAAFDCSLYYVRDPEHLVRVMSTSPSYLRTAADGQVRNYRDWGIALGRRFRALKLWCLIRSEGVSGLQARLRRDIANAKWLAEQVAATPHWRVVARCRCKRCAWSTNRPGLTGEALDAHTRAWADRVNRSGAAYLTPAVLGGRGWCGCRWGERTERADVEARVGRDATEAKHSRQAHAGTVAGPKNGTRRAPLRSPNSLAIPFIASMTNWMCSSRSTPKSAAPRITSSRFTPFANPFVFIFFLTLDAVRSPIPVGRMSAVAVMRPVISSHAYNPFSIDGPPRVTVREVVRVRQNRVMTSSG